MTFYTICEVLPGALRLGDRSLTLHPLARFALWGELFPLRRRK